MAVINLIHKLNHSSPAIKSIHRLCEEEDEGGGRC